LSEELLLSDLLLLELEELRLELLEDFDEPEERDEFDLTLVELREELEEFVLGVL